MIHKPGTVYVQDERPRSSKAQRLSPGDVVGGHYVVDDLLDEGGMAVVYRATNSATGKACALKILHAQLGDRPEFIRLFAKEAKVSSVVGDNDHIVQVYDAGLDTERGIPFIVMELLDGETLETMLEGGPLGVDLARHLLRQLQSALEQAHAAGVVHRDLKPSNVFISTGKDGTPALKVMDFGIAKVMEGEALRTATQVGTPAYNAPEQMGSTTRKLAAKQGITIAAGVSPQTDIWALGLLTYEMFTGDLPGMYWGVETLSELPMKVAFEEHEPASTRAGSNAALLPSGFDVWFARCLHKNAEKRWGSAKEAIDTLFALLDDMPITVTEEELESISTQLYQPLKAARESQRTPASIRASAVDPPPLPRISSPAITAEGARAAKELAARRSGANPTPTSGHEMMSSAPPIVTDSIEQAKSVKPSNENNGFHWSSAAGFVAVAVGVGAIVAGVSSTRGGDSSAANQPVGSSVAAANVSTDGCTDDAASAEGCTTACGAGSLASCNKLGGLLVQGKAADRDSVAALAAFSKACGTEAMAPGQRLAWTAAVESAGCTKDKCVPEACASAAKIYQNGGNGITKDARAATALYKRVCRVGQSDTGRSSHGCVGLGEQRVRAGEVAAARPYFEAACEDGLSAGCVAMATVMERGDSNGQNRDEKRARELYQKACDGGDLAGCTRLGHMVERGRGGWVRDQPAAVALYKRACDGGQLLGCVHLADAYLKGKGKLTRDAVHAVELLQNSCDGSEARACADLAVLVRSGIGGLARDDKRAFTLNQKACADGAARACVQLGEMYIEGAAGLTKDELEGRKLIDKACRGGDALGCVALSKLDADKLSPEARQKLLSQACEGGEPSACSDLGEMLERGEAGDADATAAGKLYQRACDDGAMTACTNLANLYYSGTGGLQRDAAKSVALNDKACSGGDLTGCTRLGLLYAMGHGVAVDKKRAAQLHKKACTGELSEQAEGRCKLLASKLDEEDEKTE